MEELESKPAAPYAPSEGMTTMEELRSYIRFLYGQYMEEKQGSPAGTLTLLKNFKEES